MENIEIKCIDSIIDAVCYSPNLNCGGGKFLDTHIVISFLVDISYLLCKQRYTKMTEWARKMGNNLKNKMKQARERGDMCPFSLACLYCFALVQTY